MRILITTITLIMTLMLVGCGAGAISSTATVNFSRYPAHTASPNSCTDTFDCEYWGECSFKDGLCVAAAAYQCKQSEVCRTLGQCNLKGTSCTL